MTAADIIKEFEGLRLTAYKCPRGVWTIGYGHTRNVQPGQTITEYIADALLQEDINEALGHLRRTVNVKLNDNQRDALISFIFNLGVGNFSTSTLRKKVNANPNDPTIRDEFLKWVKSGGETLQGLVRRRQAEAALYFVPF